MLDKIKGINGNENLMYSDEFTRETNEENGKYLYTVDRSTFKIVGYYIAFDGHWCHFYEEG